MFPAKPTTSDIFVQQAPILEELMRATLSLVQDQYGNYVIQHVLEHGKRRDKSAVISKMKGQIVQLAQHKFASNVVEKCVEYGTPADRSGILEEILGPVGLKNDTYVFFFLLRIFLGIFLRIFFC